jgi:prepilin-type processing-associated H-X9-DG protein
MPVTPITWTVAVAPYYRDKRFLRCPDDTSTDWTNPYEDGSQSESSTLGGQGNHRVSSYFLNLWLSGARIYGALENIKSPSKVIMLTESEDDLTRDHFHPMYWNRGDPITKHMRGYDPMMYDTWDRSRNRPYEIAVDRHNGGFNSVYMDGHARWSTWSQVWYQSPGVYEGAFDPRQ